MPTYDYECLCGHRFEMFRYFSQKDCDVRCPDCEGLGTSERRVSVPMPFRGGPAGSNRDAYKDTTQPEKPDLGTRRQ